ncbi:unnamed protein product [Haemonchus placei]|uniref:Uncharacterized protein n=1 Tax=Haemonchus placei TaxID=6290 RepID=A0A0N4WF76_HAEPC|nr:unnamed protein product [Haemonchus placei]
MDLQQLMALLKELLEEQRRQHTELVHILLHRVEDGAGDRAKTEEVPMQNVMAALSNRFGKFVFDATWRWDFPDSTQCTRKCSQKMHDKFLKLQG